MIKIEQVNLTFNRDTPIENPVLRDINLQIEEGEFVTVIGTNGAGKSSLLNLIAGDLFPDIGYILINDRDVTRLPTWRRADMVARVFQDPMQGTCTNLTIEENLALAARRGLKRSFYSALIPALQNQLADKLGSLNLNLENQSMILMGQLSGGQRQAISLLMATLQPSKILLLDEPTAALDPNTTELILSLIKHIVKANKQTTLMVTHSLKHALAYGTRTLMMHQGRIILDISGSKRAKLTVPQLLKLFEKTQGEPLSNDNLLLD